MNTWFRELSRSKFANWAKCNTDTITAIASTTIAIIALCVSLWDHHETRKYNRFAVTPRLTGHKNIEMWKIEISISNEGLGPAIVKKFVIHDGSQTKTNLDDESFLKFITAIANKYSLPGRLSVENLEAEDVIKPGAKHPIVTIDNLNHAEGKAMENALTNIWFEIEYESFYREKFQLKVDPRQAFTFYDK
jgi:hypothetical protein